MVERTKIRHHFHTVSIFVFIPGFLARAVSLNKKPYHIHGKRNTYMYVENIIHYLILYLQHYMKLN